MHPFSSTENCFSLAILLSRRILLNFLHPKNKGFTNPAL